MVSEGAQTSVHYYNQEIEDDVKMTPETDGLYHKKEQNEPGTEQSQKKNVEYQSKDTSNTEVFFLRGMLESLPFGY